MSDGFFALLKRVGAQKPGKERVIYTAIHVDEAKLRQVFVACKSPIKHR